MSGTHTHTHAFTHSHSLTHTHTHTRTLSLADFEAPVNEAQRGFFTEILQSIADIKFSPDGKYIMSRDFLTLKV